MPKLTPKQKKFCLEYLVDLNATQAYLRTFKSVKSPNAAGVEAHKLLRNPKIITYLQSLQGKQQERTEITADMVIAELAKCGFANIEDYLDVDEDVGTVRCKGFGAMPKGASRAIQSIKEKRVICKTKNKSEDMILDSTFEFKLWDKVKSLQLLGEHLGIFTKRTQIITDSPLSKIVEEIEKER